MSESCAPHLIALAERLADAGGAVLRRYFRAPLVVDDKADRSPVTIADREAERIMRAILEVERPGDGIVGEEMGSRNADAEYVWVLDPIDGTKSFITGRPIFATLIALLHRGRPILGVIDQPIVGDRWTGAAGRATRLKREPTGVRPCPALAAAILGTTAPELFDDGDRTAFQRLTASVKSTVYGGDGYTYGLLSSGYYDLVVEAQLKLYDFAALVPVVIGAGGMMTDWRGAPLDMASDGRVIAAGDPRVHAAALACLAG